MFLSLTPRERRDTGRRHAGPFSFQQDDSRAHDACARVANRRTERFGDPEHAGFHGKALAAPLQGFSG